MYSRFDALSLCIMPSQISATFRACLWVMTGLMLPGPLSADASITPTAPFVDLIQNGTQLRLEVRQATLVSALEHISRTTGIRIHIALAPPSLLTTTCLGAAVRQIVECLSGPGANLAFRYPHQTLQHKTPQSPTEIWILSTGATATQSDTVTQRETQQHEVDQTAQLLDMLSAQDATQRVSALSGLVLRSDADHGDIHRALTDALTDADAEVRAQAVSGLARREGAQAAEVLRAALHDDDASVRLMAVAHADGDTVLLQTALSDSDETVRTLAALKLSSNH